MESDKPEPGSEPIISDGTARFTVALFLALFTLGVALLIWRGLSTVPDGDHWIDQFMGALHTFSTFAAILLILYLGACPRNNVLNDNGRQQSYPFRICPNYSLVGAKSVRE